MPADRFEQLPAFRIARAADERQCSPGEPAIVTRLRPALTDPPPAVAHSWQNLLLRNRRCRFSRDIARVSAAHAEEISDTDGPAPKRW